MSGKKYTDALKKYDRDRFYAPTEALGLAKATASAKFDENVDIVFRLGVDARKSDQAVRGATTLPFGTGSEVRVAVFTQGEAADKAQAAGGDVVGLEELPEQREGRRVE